MTTPSNPRGLSGPPAARPLAARGRVTDTPAAGGRDTEAGDTLVEVLIALVVLGIAVRRHAPGLRLCPDQFGRAPRH